MSTTTTNYGLTVPELIDSPPDITVIGANFPIIDTQLKALNDGKEDLIKNAAAKTTMADADTVPLSDSAASNATKKITFANLKAALKTYFDTLYNNYVHPTTAGNKHVPSGGTAGQVLAYGGASGTAAWDTLEPADIGYTAADVLTKLKTVDGSGSGLDADLLDGNHASAFATAAQGTLASNAIPKGLATAANQLLVSTGNGAWGAINKKTFFDGAVNTGTLSVPSTAIAGNASYTITLAHGLVNAREGIVKIPYSSSGSRVAFLFIKRDSNQSYSIVVDPSNSFDIGFGTDTYLSQLPALNGQCYVKSAYLDDSNIYIILQSYVTNTTYISGSIKWKVNS